MFGRYSNQRMTTFLEDIGSLRRTLKAVFSDAGMGEDFVNCHVEWHLFTSWMEHIFTNAIKEFQLLPMDKYLEKFNRDLDYHEIMGLIFKDELLSNVVEILIAQNFKSIETEKFRKDLDKSRRYLSRSLKESQKDRLAEALDNINKALLFAPFPMDGVDHQSKSQLSFCLMTRAHLLRKLGHYNVCEKDLNDSMKYFALGKVNNYEKNIAAELLTLQDLKTPPTEAESVARRLVNLNPVSERIHGAVPYLSLSYEKNKGRIIITQNDIQKGTKLLVEEPFCTWLAPFLYSQYCFRCFNVLDNYFFPCRKCVLVRYCSSACEEESWKSYHSYECQYISFLRFLGAGHFALRCLSVDGLDESISLYRKSLQDKRKEPKLSRSFLNNYQDIFTLMSKDNNSAMLPKLAFLSKFIAHLACSMRLVQDGAVFDLSCLLLKQFGIGYLNSFFITDHGYNQLKLPGTSVDEDTAKEIGMGLYASASLISHSCDPNCEKYFICDKILILSRAPIEKGEEITISYGPNAVVHSYHQRQALLESTHGFKCSCKLCLKHE
ncbi:SET and MYND domain-containing protein DDB_G0273589 [Tetranychus urticae]|nr:SET and MYND domain-containing protein DDB_G0273589 [Tetranychus urticae]XP_015783392.1 SET and MYND domain-containing protein DDB_G0273589 [Tetranychus urticae]